MSRLLSVVSLPVTITYITLLSQDL